MNCGSAPCAQGRRLQVIVVIVADQDDVGNGQALERRRGRAYATWTEAAERPGMRGEHRVGEDHRVRGAQQKGRVADERGRDGSRDDLRWWRRKRRERHELRPRRSLARALPCDDVADGAGLLAGRVEEALAIAVVRNRQRAPPPSKGGGEGDERHSIQSTISTLWHLTPVNRVRRVSLSSSRFARFLPRSPLPPAQSRSPAFPIREFATGRGSPICPVCFAPTRSPG